MTLTDTGAHIAEVLLGVALAVAFIAFLTGVRRRRYQGPFAEPYAGFQTGARTEAGGEFVELECEGYCPGTTAHQFTGDGEATCRLCGTPRTVTPVPDQA